MHRLLEDRLIGIVYAWAGVSTIAWVNASLEGGPNWLGFGIVAFAWVSAIAVTVKECQERQGRRPHRVVVHYVAEGGYYVPMCGECDWFGGTTHSPDEACAEGGSHGRVNAAEQPIQAE